MRGEVLKPLSLKILRSYEKGAALIVVARVLRKFPLNKGGSANGAGVVEMSAGKPDG